MPEVIGAGERGDGGRRVLREDVHFIVGITDVDAVAVDTHRHSPGVVEAGVAAVQ